MKTFTKFAALGLTAACLATCFTACKAPVPGGANAHKPSRHEQAIEEKSDRQLVGGWTTAGSTQVTEEQMKYFKEAVSQLNGYYYEPAALLGTQVVSGVNYVFLCKSTLEANSAAEPLKYTYIYVNTAGQATFMGDKSVTLPGADGEQKAGGWTFAKDPAVTADIQTIVDKASETRLGAKYEAVAYIGSQVVSGKNHAILVKTTPVTADANASGSFMIITVYENLDGKCEITQTKDVNLNFG